MGPQANLSCMRRLYFCYGHRLHENTGKCSTVHGHNGVVEVYAAPSNGELNGEAMVVDFGLIKERLGGWIDENWDHTTILSEKDVKTFELIKSCPGKKEPFLLPGDPTAEHMAAYLLHRVCPELFKGSGAVIYRIVVRETPNCSAEAVFDPVSREVRQLYEPG